MTREELEIQKNLQSEKKLHAEAALKATDYKVMKNAEAIAANITPIPYNAEELHNLRQSLRDTINACEAEIARLKAIEVEEDIEVIQ